MPKNLRHPLALLLLQVLTVLAAAKLMGMLFHKLFRLTVVGEMLAGKLGGAALAARLAGMSWYDALTLGTLMNTRGLVELIVLNIGYDLGILNPRLYSMMVLMALVTTFMTGPLLSSLELLKRRGVAFRQET